MEHTESKLITHLITEILSGYESYINRFNAFSLLAPVNFKQRNWNELQQNHRKRLRLYKDQLHINIRTCKDLLGDQAGNRSLWTQVKLQYSRLILGRPDEELAESFFNSVIRKVIPNLSVDNEVMFVLPGSIRKEPEPTPSLFHTYPGTWDLPRIFHQLMEDYDFGAPFFNREEDIGYLVKGFKEVILSRYVPSEETTIQVLKSVFYRNKAAYLIGRIFIGGKWMPFLIPFVHNEKGVFVDTLIFNPNIMSSVFSYTRSYFMAEIKVPAQVISFLTSVIKNKKKHELYNAIGFNKHGKTEFYRDFLDHLANSNDQFVLAPGIKGMVMTVFTLPSYNIVFKLIKDHFEPPKNLTRQQVREKYQLVSLHDRVGRMADTHEFEEFHLPLDRIHPELLQELKNTTNSLLEIKGETLIINHLYTERRMQPLNLFLENCTLDEAKQAVEEYGNSIMQLAQANIFPGDMMVKNFGVTRQRRVVFYDYDEIEFLLDMNFRQKPRPETFEQIYASQPWYDIAANDVFPEDFRRFMIGRQDVKEHFFEVHKNLFDPAHWRQIQDKLNRGELIHAFPYPENIRFRPNEKI